MDTLICIVAIIGAIILVKVQKRKEGIKAYEDMKIRHQEFTHNINKKTLYEYGEENFIGIYGEENFNLVKNNQDTEIVRPTCDWSKFKMKDEHGVNMRSING